MRELHLFAGAGGGILGGMLLGHTPVCAVEIKPHCRGVLLQRQRDGLLPRFPIWDDIKTFDARPWRGRADVVCGGFPCQDISCAGDGAGLNGERSGLWREMARVVREVGPRYVLVENSPILTSRGLGRVLGDLAALGYDARWCVRGGGAVGCAHYRERIWIFAYPAGEGGDAWDMLETGDKRRPPQPTGGLPRLLEPQKWRPTSRGAESESGLCGLVDGLASGLERLAATGNGQIPAVAALAWRMLAEPVISHGRTQVP